MLTVSTSVSKTESPGSNPGAPAIVGLFRDRFCVVFREAIKI